MLNIYIGMTTEKLTKEHISTICVCFLASINVSYFLLLSFLCA